MDGTIFLEWAKIFVNETIELRSKYAHLVLFFDRYCIHVLCKTLMLLHENGIVVNDLPGHTSYCTQVLDHSVFSPFKNHFQNLFNKRAAHVQSGARIDVYRIWEMLTMCFRRSLTYDNIMRGSKACGVWCYYRRGVVTDVINARDFTNLDGNRIALQALTIYQEVVLKCKSATYRWHSEV